MQSLVDTTLCSTTDKVDAHFANFYIFMSKEPILFLRSCHIQVVVDVNLLSGNIN